MTYKKDSVALFFNIFDASQYIMKFSEEFWDDYNIIELTECITEKDMEHYNRWINEISEYINYDHNAIIKLALSYLLQSLRHNEDIKRFQWGDKDGDY